MKRKGKKTMLKILLFLCSLLICFESFAFEENKLTRNQQEDYQVISRSLKCLTCMGQSVFESDVPMALAVKAYVKKSLLEGKTKQEIIDNLQQKYGDAILFSPSNHALILMLWLMPFLALIIGFYLIYSVYTKRKSA